MKNLYVYIMLIGEVVKVDWDIFVDDDMSYFEGYEMKIVMVILYFIIMINKIVNLMIELLI